MKYFLIALFTAYFPFLSITHAIESPVMTQHIRGKTFDSQTLEIIVGSTVVLTKENVKLYTVSDQKGMFVINNVPIGKWKIEVSYLGYQPYVADNLWVNTGNEIVLDVGMEILAVQMEEAEVTARIEKENPVNQMALSGVRMLSSEEANRYAGSWGDPARMVSNLAGIATVNDNRNDIIVRGNSPVGILWVLDGFEIPNPNHFGSLGGTGGPIGMINNNQLANSDFYTGAFPAQFGNATSGVFDLKLRTGNYKKQQFLASLGFNGVEFGAEGYFSKKCDASYMINGRYSFLELLSFAGIDFGTGTAIPKYQDLCAKVNIPLKSGSLSIVTLLGASTIHMKDYSADTAGFSYKYLGDNTKMDSYQLFFGTNYTVRFSSSTRMENRISYLQFTSTQSIDQIYFTDCVTRNPFYRGKTNEGQLTYAPSVYHRFNARNFFSGGVNATLFLNNLHDYSYVQGDKYVMHDVDKTSFFLKGFAHWKHKFNDQLSLVPGVYGQFYALNNTFSIEPRLALKWQILPKFSLNAASGLHSQLQPRLVYFYYKEGALPNKNLDMTRSMQYVVGADWMPFKKFRVKADLYYQYLFDVPIIPTVPYEWMLNFGDDYYDVVDFVFENGGTGKNYGIELTVERFLGDGYYFLITGSLYQSKYKGYDKVERNTKFAGNFSLNILGGYEWKIKETMFLSVNVKFAWLGGKRFIPLKVLDNSDGDYLEYGYDYDNAYSKRYPDYLRLDVNLNMKINYSKFALEWFIEIDNVTNRKNIFSRVWDWNASAYTSYYQMRLFPMGGCRFYF